MPLSVRHSRFIFAGSLAVSALLAIADSLMPLGIAGGILQVPVVLVSLWIPGRRSTIVLGIVGSVLAVLGFFLSPVGYPVEGVVANRILALFGILAATVFVLRFKKSRQELSESQARCRSVLDAAGEGIITFDEGGTVRSINRAAARTFGRSSDEVVGRSIEELLEHVGQGSILSVMNGSGFKSGNGMPEPTSEEVLGKRSDGATFPLHAAFSTVDLGRETLHTVVIRDITERRRLERKLIGIPEDERQEIGYELHEGIGQMLNGIRLLAEDLAAGLENRHADAARSAQRIAGLLSDADDRVAELIYQLTPVNLAANELSAALRNLLESVDEKHSIETKLIATGSHAVHDNTVVTHLYRIAREALANAIEHGRASRLTIRLHQAIDEIYLQVEDDGIGMPARRENIEGMGIRVMEYRARIIGATFQIDAAPGRGTSVECRLTRRRIAPPAPESLADVTRPM